MLTKSDIAKYPFTKEGSDYVRRLGIRLEELTSGDYEPILERAVSRVQQAVLKRVVEPAEVEDEIEILSFPVAVLIAGRAEDPYLRKRYALAEAKKASAHLEAESPEKLMEVAGSFGWKVSTGGSELSNEVKLRFTDYLRNASRFNEERWKLVNRRLMGGEVYLTLKDTSRLLEEEIRQHIENKLEVATLQKLPESIERAVVEVRHFFKANVKQMASEEITGEVNVEAFPPCVSLLYTGLRAGKNISHSGRFTLTAFLLNAGMSVEDLVKLYTAATDFDERMTRYQVQHIAGLAGGGTRYRPLSCSNMLTHNLCKDAVELCSRVKHPLTFYMRKLRSLEKPTKRSIQQPS